jgi:uncharacterized protein YxeA
MTMIIIIIIIIMTNTIHSNFRKRRQSALGRNYVVASTYPYKKKTQIDCRFSSTSLPFIFRCSCVC